MQIYPVSSDDGSRCNITKSHPDPAIVVEKTGLVLNGERYLEIPIDQIRTKTDAAS